MASLFVCLFLFFVFFLFLFFCFCLIYPDCRQFSIRKESTRFPIKTAFFNGVLSGKATSNGLVHRAQGFHSKNRSSSPLFALFLGIFLV